MTTDRALARRDPVSIAIEPPNDVPAEQAALGAAIQSAAALAEVVSIVPAGGWYRPGHDTVLAAAVAVAKRGQDPDPILVAAELDRAGQLEKVGGLAYLHTLMAAPATFANAGHYATIVAEKAAARLLAMVGGRLQQYAMTAHTLGEIGEALARARADLQNALPAANAGRPAFWELDAFLDRDTPEHDWLVPGLLERMDRLILTGPEGGGKSTLLRQLAVQLASGIHPFDGGEPAPLRVLLLDLENSEAQVHRKLRPLRLAAGRAYPGGTLALHVRPEGLDLLQPDDVAWLAALVEDTAPDVVVTGPLYKLAGGDPTEERTAQAVRAHLDHLRATYGVAILLEAHSPHAGTPGGKRPERPYGASLWMRWPEFGLFLDPDSGALRHWRGARDEREWPAALQRGGAWPWTVVTRFRDVLWARIVEQCVREGGRPSYGDLAKRLGVSRGAVQKAIEEHRDQWEAMA